MSETEKWPEEWPISACEWADQREETIEKLHEDIGRLRTRLAAYERQTIQRDESVPDWASMWVKGIGGRCEYVGILGDTSEAPDFRPDAAGPLMQPIVDVE